MIYLKDSLLLGAAFKSFCSSAGATFRALTLRIINSLSKSSSSI
jgi:hypothetical protein